MIEHIGPRVTGVAGASNESRLQALQGSLTRAMTAMQLALISVSVSLEPRVAVAPFRFLRGAFQNAHDWLVQMEMGRERRLRLCGGELWRRGIRLASGGDPIDAMQRLFDVRVSLQRGEPTAADDEDNDDDDDDDDDDDGGEKEEQEYQKKAGMQKGDAEARGSGGGGHGRDELTLRFDPLNSGGDGDGDGGSGSGSGGEAVVLPMERGLRFRRMCARQRTLRPSGILTTTLALIVVLALRRAGGRGSSLGRSRHHTATTSLTW